MLTLGNKLTLNSSKPIYHFVNKYSIDFDGVDDRIITDDADTVAQPTTYSFWCKSSTTAQNFGVFGHGGNNQGAFHFNVSNSPLLWLNSSFYRYWADTPAQDDGKWHHWVVYADTNDITNSKLYVDGVLQTSGDTNSSGSTLAYTQSLTIGGDKAVGGNYFEGKIDEFAVFDRELTQDEITRMYNTYYSPNRVANGNFSQIGNEEVTNGDFSQEGSELVTSWTNKDFSSFASNGSNITQMVSSGSGNNNYSALTITSGKTYKLKFTSSQAITCQIRISANTNLTSASVILNSLALGTNEVYFTAPSNYAYIGFYAPSSFTDTQISSFTLKEVGQSWSFVGESELTSQGARIYSSAGANSYIQQSSVFTINKQYKFNYTIVNSTQGSLKLTSVNGGDLTINSTVGTHTVFITANNAALSILRNSGVTDVTITNISVKEVGQHWELNSTAIFTANGINITTGGYIRQDVLTLGKSYKLTYDIISYTSGNIRVYDGTDKGNIPTVLGSNTFNFISGGSQFWVQSNSASVNLVIDNIVVQELKHDATNLMLNAGAYQSANPLITSTKSMEFDGTDDYLNAGVLPDVFRNAFTVSAWVWTDTGSGYHQIISTGQGAFSQIFQESTTLVIQTRVSSPITKYVANYFNSAHQNKWVYLTVVYNGSTIKAYRNGIEVLSDSLSGTLSSTSNSLNIGRYISNVEFWNGKITELGLYDRGLTSLEVASLYNQGMPTNLLVNRNNYQSGNPTVFNTKQVDFDGADDRLVANSTLGSMTGSISFWFKRDTATRQDLIDLRGGSGVGEIYFAGSDLNASVSSGTIYVNGVAGSVNMALNKWHHLVVTGMTINITEFIAIGCRFNFTYFFNGQMSQIGLWNSTLTADEVSSLYNHGLPIDLKTNQAAYESSSNLVGYWRMGSGTLDSYPLIADQTNPTLGSEVVVNGDFATDSNWNKGANTTISGGKLNSNSAGVYIIANQSAILNQNQVCKYSVTYTITSGSVRLGDSATVWAGSTQSTSGTYTGYVTVASTANGTLFFTSPSSDFVGSIDNVSVKQVNGNPAIMTNQTSSDIENGSPYANIVQNGTFDTDSDWNKGTGWAIANGKANATSASSDLFQIGVPFSLNKTYKLTYTISNYSQGNTRSILGGYIFGSTRNTNGTFTDILTPTNGSSNSYVYIEGQSGFTGSIDNVTVEEVNTGLQGYWKMGDGTNDEYPVIYDQTDTTSEAITVRTPSTQTWDNSSSVSRVNDDSANSVSLTSTASNSYVLAYLSNAGILNTVSQFAIGIYKLSFTVSTSGTIFPNRTMKFYNTGSTFTATNIVEGQNTIYGIINTANNNSHMNLSASATGQNIIISNITLDKLSGNGAFMTNMLEGNITNQYPLTKIRNYYRMGDGILDGYPIIQDQTSPNLAHIPTTNVILYSNDFSNAQWQKLSGSSIGNRVISPDGTLNGWEIIFDGTTSGRIEQARTGMSSGENYSVSVFARVSSGTQTVEFGSVTTATYTLNTQWQRLTRMEAENDTISYSRIVCNDSATIEIFGFQLEQQSQATAYIKTDGIAAVRKSSTTNLIPYSEDFSQWNIKQGTETLNYGISPDGTQNSTRIVFSGANLQFSKQLTTGTPSTGSIYVKGVNGETINFGLEGSESIFTLNGEWQRIQKTGTATSNKITVNTYGGATARDIQVWGAQVEQQTQAETYAKTTGLPVTIDLFTENNYGTMTNMSSSDIVEDTPNN